MGDACVLADIVLQRGKKSVWDNLLKRMCYDVNPMGARPPRHPALSRRWHLGHFTLRLL